MLSTRVKAAYEHKQDMVHKKKHRVINEDGAVIIGPRNILTNPARKGHLGSTVGHLFGKFGKYDQNHMAEPYDRARQMRIKETARNRRILSA